DQERAAWRGRRGVRAMDHRADALRPVKSRAGGPPAGRSRAIGPVRRRVSGLALLLLAVAELAWLLWCLIVPLPNANNLDVPVREPIRRGWLLLKALPEVVPETSFRESLLGRAVIELSHLEENLPQRMPIALAAALIATAAIGLGDAVLIRPHLAGRLRLGERLALDYGLGAALLGIITLLTGRIGWLNPWTCRIGLGGVAVAWL